MQISIGNVSLTGNIPAEQLQQFRFASECQVQDSPAINADQIVQFLRGKGNKKTTITFSIQRVHATSDDAAYFCLAHEAQFPVQGKLTYQSAAGELYFANAVAVLLQGDFTGATTTHSYRVTAGGTSTSGNAFSPPVDF